MKKLFFTINCLILSGIVVASTPNSPRSRSSSGTGCTWDGLNDRGEHYEGFTLHYYNKDGLLTDIDTRWQTGRFVDPTSERNRADEAAFAADLAKARQADEERKRVAEAEAEKSKLANAKTHETVTALLAVSELPDNASPMRVTEKLPTDFPACINAVAALPLAERNKIFAVHLEPIRVMREELKREREEAKRKAELQAQKEAGSKPANIEPPK